MMRDWMGSLMALILAMPVHAFLADGLRKAIRSSVGRSREGVVKLRYTTETIAGIAGCNDVWMWEWCTVLVRYDLWT